MKVKNRLSWRLFFLTIKALVVSPKKNTPYMCKVYKCLFGLIKNLNILPCAFETIFSVRAEVVTFFFFEKGP